LDGHRRKPHCAQAFLPQPGQDQRAQKVLQARTETETIERALDAVIDEDEKNRITFEANEHFFASGAKIRDLYGKLAK